MRALGTTTLLLLGACSGEPEDPLQDVPFPLGNPSSALFMSSPGSNLRSGIALVLLSKGDLRCADVHTREFDDDILAALEGEDGLLFVLQHRQRGDVTEGADPWSGLWMSAPPTTSSYRQLVPYALVDGFVTPFSGGYYGDGGAWLDLERADTGAWSARYHTELWSGAAQLRDCGTWGPPRPGRDTGLDSEREDTGRWDTDDVDSADGVYAGPLQLQSVTFNCDSQAWWYDVLTFGWQGETRLYISQTGVSPEVRWHELGHRFWATESYEDAPTEDTRGYYDPAGYWDNPYLELEVVQAVQDAVIDETSLFQCNSDRINTMTWAVEVDDLRGATVGCFAWGHDPSDQDQYDFAACDVI